MMKLLLFFFLLFATLDAEDIYNSPVFQKDTKENEILTEKEILMANQSILNDAIKYKDYDTISKVAISFFFNAENPMYNGNKRHLQDRALELLELCVDGGDAKSALFLMVRFQKSNPNYAMSIAEKILKKRKIGRYTSIPLIYAALVLDNDVQDKEKINLAIDGLFSIEESANSNFYAAFLFRALGNIQFANMYLDNACHMAKPSTNIYNFCVNGDMVEKVDTIESKVIKKDCQLDIGRRCK